MATIGFPIATILSVSGTYTEETFFSDLDATNARSLLFGVNVSSLTGGTGVDVALQGKAPDGLYYGLGQITNLDGQEAVRVDGPIPSTLQVQFDLAGGATSATVSLWVIGQA